MCDAGDRGGENASKQSGGGHALAEASGENARRVPQHCGRRARQGADDRRGAGVGRRDAHSHAGAALPRDLGGVQGPRRAHRTRRTPRKRESLICTSLDMMLNLCNRGLSQVLRIKPPMCISKQDADFAADILQLAIARLADRIKNKKL